MSKRKKPSASPEASAGEESVTTRAAVPRKVMDQARAVGESSSVEVPAEEIAAPPPAQTSEAPEEEPFPLDPEMTVNLVGDLPIPGRDDLDAPTVSVEANELAGLDGLLAQRKHLRGLLEALVFASDGPIKERELAKLANAQPKQVKELLDELSIDYRDKGINIEEVAGGWVMRTSVQYAPFVRDLTKQKPVKLTRAQVETLAIIAYRQPITRPEMDDVRGVDSGPVVKLLLERDLIRILGKRDEPGRPLIYGTTQGFLEFFGLKSLKDLPTLREFTELSDESKDTYEAELGEPAHDPSFGETVAENGEEPPPSLGRMGAATVEVAIENIHLDEHPMSSFSDDDLEPMSEYENSDDGEGHEADDTTLTSEAPPPPDPNDDED